MSRVQRLLQSRTAGGARTARVNREPDSEQRADLAARRGRPVARTDFAGVKIHTDPEAAETVDALGARAFTHGRDIFFGSGQFAPNNKSGDALLAHELTHVHDQVATGQAAVQFAPNKGQPGIGANPPEQPFVRISKPGPEQRFVLFKQDSATLTGAAGRGLVEALKGQTGPLLVKLYGYASSEGKDEYNVNLSAHRSVAVKGLLDAHLPAGSKVELYAHGETNEFGTLGNNRRVGVWFGPLPAEVGTKPKMSLKMRKEDQEADPVPAPVSDGTRYPIGPIEPLPDPAFQFGRRLSLLDDFQLDWRGLNEPGAFRGVRLGERDARAAVGAGRVIYGNMLRLGLGPGAANWWTNRVLQSTFDARLALEHPTLLDLSAREMQRFDPNFTQLVVPVMTPEVLNWLIKKTFKKDIDFHF